MIPLRSPIVITLGSPARKITADLTADITPGKSASIRKVRVVRVAIVITLGSHARKITADLTVDILSGKSASIRVVRVPIVIKLGNHARPNRQLQRSHYRMARSYGRYLNL